MGREEFLLVFTFSVARLSKPIRFNRQLILGMKGARCQLHTEAISPARVKELWAKQNQQANQKQAISWSPHASQSLDKNN